MICFEANTADQAWRRAAQRLQGQTEIQAGRDRPTRELLHVAFSISDPRQRIVFARPINPAFAVAEVIWILSGSDSSEFITFWNPRLRRFRDGDRRAFHGAYGARLGSRPKLPTEIERELRVEQDKEPYDQLRMAYKALQHTPDSRQVVLQIWDMKRDLPDPEPRSEDVPCNLTSHIMIRQGRLEWLQIMRSNDLMWGTPNNFVQFTSLQEIMAGWLGVDVGSYVHVSDSLHVYQRHWTELDGLEVEISCELPRNEADLRISGYREWELVFESVATAAVKLSKGTDPIAALDIVEHVSEHPVGYREWVALLAAESLMRSGFDAEAIQMSSSAGDYWAESWRLWHDKNREAEKYRSR